jgi:hypothetical protein
MTVIIVYELAQRLKPLYIVDFGGTPEDVP